MSTKRWFYLGRFCMFCVALFASALVLSAATYLPMSDADLARSAPLIARAGVVATSVELEQIRGENRPVTLVTLRLLEAIKGDPGETFVVSLPGGRVGEMSWAVPGTPDFSPGSDVVLMLAPLPGRPGRFRLTELGLSKFDLVVDDTGRRFAIRLAFPADADRVVSRRAQASGSGASVRDAESFLSFLRSASRSEAVGEVAYSVPVAMRTKWLNIGGREPGDCSPANDPGSGPPCLWRWFWDASSEPSPNAVVKVNGTQSNLQGSDEPKCGTDSICDVQNATTAWPGVAATDIRLSGSSTSGTITVNLDSTESPDNGMTWNTPVGCAGGVIGLGGPNEGTGPRTYRGDSTYYAITSGTVAMRKNTCGLGYSAATFRSAVLHEVGHVLGLDHPDQRGESIHSTTTSADWSNAVMHAVISVFKPDTPQTDDIQAVQYLYGTAAVGPPPAANFTFSPSSPPALSEVFFTDTSTDGPTGWNWDFGDPGSNDNTATTQTATHHFTKAQTYNVTLTAGNLNGSNSITFPVTATPPLTNCTPDPEALCLNHGRFRVATQWAKTDLTSGSGNAVSLTDDSGYFWFFDPSNIEVIVKVLDGCDAGGHYWVFAAGLTNVFTYLSVIDTTNSSQKNYQNPQGTPFTPIQDTGAFSSCP